MMLQDRKTENVLIVDDVVANLVVLTDIIKKAGYIARPVTSVKQAMDAIEAKLPDLILLDITMPEIDGFEYCSILKKNVKTREIPVIFISAMASPEIKEKGFLIGGVDFIQKPFEEREVSLRVETHLKLYRMQRELEEYNKQLQKTINAQVRKMNEQQHLVIFALAKMAEGRDKTSEHHAENVGKNARILAMSLQFSPRFSREISNEFVDMIEMVAPLHDLGKITIPDRILLKAGKLTPAEMEIMKTHSVLGADSLREIYEKSYGNPMLKMAIDITESHHERWDGTGYPHGLSGTDIPLSARITAVVDVYDTLCSKRCYKDAYSHEKALEIINAEAGKSFDPDIIEVFNKVQRQIKH